MLNAIDSWFLQKEEPGKSCLLFLRKHILRSDNNITEAWKYGMPFYLYKGKMFCYLWTHKTHLKPYIGFGDGNRIHHAALLQEKRARMKIFLIDAGADIPVKTIDILLKKALALYLH